MATQRKTVLTLGERIRQSIGLGESHFREFKSAYEQRPEGPRRRDPKSIARDIAETLVAFANAEGGEVIAGVEDDLSITGVPHIRELLDIILAAPTTYVHTDTPLPNPRVSQLQIANMPGSRILYFSVQKSTNRIHLTSDGRCLQRRDKENVPVSVEHIQYQRQVKKAMEYDREFVSDAEVSDLDIAMVSEIAERIMAGGHDAGDDVTFGDHPVKLSILTHRDHPCSEVSHPFRVIQIRSAERALGPAPTSPPSSKRAASPLGAYSRERNR